MAEPCQEPVSRVRGQEGPFLSQGGSEWISLPVSSAYLDSNSTAGVPSHPAGRRSLLHLILWTLLGLSWDSISVIHLISQVPQPIEAGWVSTYFIAEEAKVQRAQVPWLLGTQL